MRRLFGKLVSFGLLWMLAFAAQGARKTELQGTPRERLFTLAAQSEKIAVIVGVDVEGGWDVSAMKIPEKAARQRQQARATKERILRNHPRAWRVPDRDFEFIPYYLLAVDAKTLESLMNDPDVVSIEENREGKRTLIQSTAIIASRAANLRGYTGQGKTVVLLDDGVERNHPFLAHAMYDTEGACFSGTEWEGYGGDTGTVCPNGQTSQPNNLRTEVNVGRPCAGCYHGTEVAGAIVGKSVNNNMYGVAPDAELFPIQVYSRTGQQCGAYPCTVVRRADVIAALEYIHTWAPYYWFAAVNMSFDFNDYVSTRTACNNANGALRNAIITVYMDNIAVVTAAGNAATTQSSSPSCIDYAYSVGATTDSDTIASYSNRPTYLDFFAPGGSTGAGNGIVTSNLGGGYIETTGTSLAAPHVSGAFALLRQRQPSAAVSKHYTDLRVTGTNILLPTGQLVPRINVDAALNRP